MNNEQPAPLPLPSTMKSPRDRREGIWRGGVLQIHLGRSCDLACFGCTQGSNLGGKSYFMTPEQFEVAIASLKGYWGVIGLFGGNPCLSPHFDAICEIFRKTVPFEQRGLWSNNLRGKGAICRQTFNPRVSNLNVHTDMAAYEEMKRDWPECRPLDPHSDSRHAPPYVAMQDIQIEADATVTPQGIQAGQASEHRKLTEAEMLMLAGGCDVNQFWSAMICVFRGELRAFFCELAGAQAMLHQHEPDYPDLGSPVVPGWWDQPMSAFDAQVRHHCFACGVPLRGYGELAVGGKVEQVSQTHAEVFKPKRAGREVQLVQLRSELGAAPLPRMTDYIPNSKIKQ